MAQRFGTPFVRLITSLSIDHNFFSLSESGENLLESPKITPHLKCVAILPCEMSMS